VERGVMKDYNDWHHDNLIAVCLGRGLAIKTPRGARKTTDELRWTLRADDVRRLHLEEERKRVKRTRRRSKGALR
jgi:hypothetical protein